MAAQPETQRRNKMIKGKNIKFSFEELDLIRFAAEHYMIKFDELLQKPEYQDRLELFVHKIDVLKEIVNKVKAI
jgi:hypothetical protein